MKAVEVSLCYLLCNFPECSFHESVGFPGLSWHCGNHVLGLHSAKSLAQVATPNSSLRGLLERAS